MSGATPWGRWMQIGLGVLGLAPRAFWRLSLREWCCALEGLMEARGAAMPAPLSRAELHGMLSRYALPTEKSNGN